MDDGFFMEDLRVGMAAHTGKTISEADVLLFSAVSTDVNPVHLDAEFAATTRFKGRIVHGLLSAGLISAVLANKLPGPGCIYLSQSLRFRAPVRIGDTVTATVEVIAVDAVKHTVTLSTICTVAGKTVIEGEAVVIPPSQA